MTARVEAAAKALYQHHEAVAEENGATLISPPADEYDCCAEAVLAAADAVMFDDAAVERIALLLAQFDGWPLFDGFKPDRIQMNQARAIFAALKGDAK